MVLPTFLNLISQALCEGEAHCVCRYVSSNPQYADAGSYTSKFRQLQQRAMATMRTKVAQVLQRASHQVTLCHHTPPCVQQPDDMQPGLQWSGLSGCEHCCCSTHASHR